MFGTQMAEAAKRIKAWQIQDQSQRQIKEQQNATITDSGQYSAGKSTRSL